MNKNINRYFISNPKYYPTTQEIKEGEGEILPILSCDIEQCVTYLKKIKVIGIDIETTIKEETKHLQTSVYKGGLDPYLSDIVMLQIGDTNSLFVFDLRDFTKDDLKPLLDFLHWNKEVLFVGHNLRFEAKHLAHKYGIKFRNVYDTMIVEMTLTNGVEETRYGLADLAEKYLNIKKKQINTLFSDETTHKKVTLDEEYLMENEDFITPFEVVNNYELDKSTRLQFLKIGNKQFTEEQVLYGGDDILFPLFIRERQMLGRKIENGINGEFEIYNPKIWQKIENKYLLVLADLELNGMYVDQERWMKIYYDNLEVFNKRKEALNTYVLKYYPNIIGVQYELFSNSLECNIEWSSSKQVIAFFKKIGIEVRAFSKQTKRVELTVGAAELLKTIPNNLKILYMKDKDAPIEDRYSLTLAYLLFKKSEQAVTTFGQDWIKKYIHPITKRAHSTYRQILNTTRISSTNPNCNNISNGEWRECFREEGSRTMVQSDFSAQELRVAAALMEDRAMMNFFNVGDAFYGDDFHAFSATKVFKLLENNPELIVPPKEIEENGIVISNPAFTKEDGERRTTSKTLIFKLLYGGVAESFVADLGITLDEANGLVNSYLNAFPGMKDYFDDSEYQSRLYNYVLISKELNVRWFHNDLRKIEDLTNEVWSYFPQNYRELSKARKEEIKKEIYTTYPHVKGLWSKIGRLKSGLERKWRNYRIQGVSSVGILKPSTIMYREYAIENNKDWKMIGNIYDEILTSIPIEEAKESGEILKRCMETGGKFGTPTVKHVAKYVIADAWGH